MIGIIVKALSGFYYVDCLGEIYECKARGNFRKIGVSPLVGDRVCFEKTDKNSGIVNEILPRKNAVSRPPVANIDKLFIVSAYSMPIPNTLLIDKMTVIANQNNVEPIIVFNKSDMGDFTDWQSIYTRAGFKTYVISAKTGRGIPELKNELQGVVSAFTGNSGVGKSSILNSILGDKIIPTGEISEKLGRGRHTTRHTQLYKLSNGGFVVDTPGFSTLELETSDSDLKEKLPYYFYDFKEYLSLCKFTSCTHVSEKGCGVIEAVKNGLIEKNRHDSYVELFNEIKDIKPWQAKKSKNK